jgi:hypothetical protein
MLSEGIISKIIPTNPVLLNHFKNNRDMTNQVIFGKHINTLIGFATSGTTARAMGTVTPLQVGIAWARTGSLGIANITAAGTVASAGVTVIVNAPVVAGVLEGGILLGSGLNALIQTYIQND